MKNSWSHLCQWSRNRFGLTVKRYQVSRGRKITWRWIGKKTFLAKIEIRFGCLYAALQKTWSVFHSWRSSTTFWPILHVHKKSVPPTSFEIRIWILNNTSTSPLNQSNQSTKNEIKSSKYSNNFKFLNYVKLDGNAVLEKFLRIIIASSLIFYGKS